ncbi:hypothetical protein [Nocardiopsis sp. NPDC006938]|uniref:hypothetical protein n=1 Tax=Nocardiopsis sp. NPDC006938 TaxID=3364337 RepID=UPI00369E2512
MYDDTKRGTVTPRRAGRVLGAILTTTAVALLVAGCPAGGGGGGGGGGYGTVDGETKAEKTANSVPAE